MSFSNEMKSDGVVDPSNVQYTNDSIANEFSCGTELRDTAGSLANGSLDKTEIPAIRVVKHRGHVYSLDNRRLWAFKQAGVRSIPVIWRTAESSLLWKLNGNSWDVRVRGGSRARSPSPGQYDCESDSSDEFTRSRSRSWDWN